MKVNFFASLFLLCSMVVSAQSPAHLRCEYLENPLGIDARSPRFTWLLDDNRYEAKQTAYRLIVDTDSSAVVRGQGAYWDTKKNNEDKMLAVYSGKELIPFTKYYWSVHVWDKDGVEKASPVASFETGMMDMSNWKGTWISDGHTTGGNSIKVKPAPYFRKEFETPKKVKSARAYIAVAGLYELSINGETIGDHRLDPMFTRFDRRNLYVTYDVTRQIQSGKNAVGVLLGNGWYNHQSTAVWYFDRAPWRNRPAFCLDLRIVYEDGSVEIVKTGSDWKTNLSPVIFNSIYTAEHYDARLEQPGWHTSGFEDSKWKPVTLRPAPSQNIVAQQMPPIRNLEKIPAKTMKKMSDTRYIFDLGRNISGVSQLRVKGEAGTEIRLKHAEIILADTLYMRNIEAHYRPTDNSDPFATDIFILNGKGEEIFMPRFNYKGFQYVEVTSDKPITLTKESLDGWFMHSDIAPTGQVETSNPLINKMWWAANNSYLSNMFGYPTDCPQREKNGWTGDVAFLPGFYNFDVITLYEKWLADHRDEQQPNGVLPAIIPTSGWGYHWANGTDWTSTIAIIPWIVYQFYGDSKLLADCYENIKLYTDYITGIAPDDLTNWGLGDWVPVKSRTPVEYTSSIYYYRVVSILANAAQLFDKQDDYKKYTALAEKIKSAVNAKYLKPETGIYIDGNQTELSMAIVWGIVPDELRAKTAAALAKRVEADGKHLDVGLLGSVTILHALSENGYADHAYALASQDTYPSWGYWFAKDNATTFYESWGSIENLDGDGSLNHIMFGEVDAWFFKGLGGIHPDPKHPGFKNILLKPNFVAGLNNAEISHISPYGEIVSSWKREKKSVVYRITIPANSTATLYLPKAYSLKQAKLRSGEMIKPENLPDGSYSLVAGSYELVIK
jgi:alpha-L-rhamnosidase